MTHDHSALVSRLPIGFAHRGGPQRPGGWRVTDNTITTFRDAHEAGVSGIESDVRLTADGVPVLDHDGVVPPGRSRLADTKRADLPGHIPTLADYYEACGTDVELSLDLLDRNGLQQVLEVAREYGALDRLWIVTSWPHGRDWRAEVGPEPHLVAGVSLGRFRAGFTAQIEEIGRSDYCTVNMVDRRWSRHRVATTHRNDLLALGWNAHRSLPAHRLRWLGVDGVFSDSVALLTKLFPRK